MACVIDPNPDVTGTGIRASIYTLCLASGVLKTLIKHITSENNYEEFCQSLNSALQLQGLALLCTAIVQTFQGQLTLFHAICVLHLLSLLGFGLVAQRKYSGVGVKRWAILAFFRAVIACAFIALTTNIWLTAPTFGSQPICNSSTLYVVFGISIKATDDVFRYIILAFMASMAVGWVISMIIWVIFARCLCGRRGRPTSQDVQMFTNLWRQVKIADNWRNELSRQLVEMLIYTGINVYMIVTLEQIVARNNLSEEEKEWTFGQVLAIFVLLGVVVEVINILLAKVDGDGRAGETSFGVGTERRDDVRDQRLLAIGHD
ncbi:hypothetical protein CKAH01_18947 [Colletotrichum kahawae]|uniref:Uncharacterized protein n=1 Tax=Colletotrichum kahawae TaxID=34407 RepID=A0AAD9Y4G2_COLKA|nr:hypothetical protein CKAH01_18947 [Colletotrichum kahawae]